MQGGRPAVPQLWIEMQHYTMTYHSYLSRPIFLHKPSFEAWPDDLQAEMQAAVTEAVDLQRQLHDQAEIDSAEVIKQAGGEIVELTPAERAVFVDSVAPIYEDAQTKFSRELLNLVNL